MEATAKFLEMLLAGASRADKFNSMPKYVVSLTRLTRLRHSDVQKCRKVPETRRSNRLLHVRRRRPPT